MKGMIEEGKSYVVDIISRVETAHAVSQQSKMNVNAMITQDTSDDTLRTEYGTKIDDMCQAILDQEKLFQDWKNSFNLQLFHKRMTASEKSSAIADMNTLQSILNIKFNEFESLQKEMARSFTKRDISNWAHSVHAGSAGGEERGHRNYAPME